VIVVNETKNPFQADFCRRSSRLPGRAGGAALAGHNYTDLKIREGGQASLEYLRVHFGNVPEKERRKVRQHLECYCGQDTEGMVWITDALQKHAG